MFVPRHLGTGAPCRGPGRGRGESSDSVIPGKRLADLDQSDSQVMSKLGQWARQPISAPSDRGAGPTLIGKLGDVLANVGVELPGAAIHGRLLSCLELRIDKAASPGRVGSSYAPGTKSAASSRRSASSTSISPRSTASKTARRTGSSCAAD